jgi:hypothetical protein
MVYPLWYCPRAGSNCCIVCPEQIDVKVKENWRQDERLLKRYGYGGEIQAL